MSDENNNKIERFFCNSCGQKTKHFVRAQHTATEEEEFSGTSFIQVMKIVECCGCEHLAFAKRTHFSEDVGYENHPATGELQLVPNWDETIYPPVTSRSPPPWFEDLPDPTLRQISEEVYKSLQSESLYLATFGSRTLLDRLLVLIVGDQGNFEKGLNALVSEGKISQHERDILAPVLEAGHAAAHRGWAPAQQQIKTILDTVEGLVHRLLVLPKLTEELEEAVPGRKSASKAKSISQVNIEKKIADAPAVVKSIFEALEAQLKALGNDVAVHRQKHYVSYKRSRNFASVQIYNQKRQVRVYLNIDPEETDLSREGLRDVRQVGHYGTGNLEVTIRSKKELESFADLFESSYRNS